MKAPTDSYYKARRFSVLVSAVLAFAVEFGIKPTAEDRFGLGSITLDDPNNIPVILALALAYAIWQFFVAWSNQESDVQSDLFIRIDAYVTNGIAVLVALRYAYTFIPLSGKSIWVKIGLLSPGFVIWVICTVALVEMAKKVRFWRAKRMRAKEDILTQMLTREDWLILTNIKEEGLVGSIIFQRFGALENPTARENSWRISGGRLEILDESGKVYSRFFYDDASMEFKHTNEPDTYSPRDQTIYRRPPG
ncbi:MAG: hypothetical protein AB7P12_04490 [Alphaproteobacteria bacterium]